MSQHTLPCEHCGAPLDLQGWDEDGTHTTDKCLRRQLECLKRAVTDALHCIGAYRTSRVGESGPHIDEAERLLNSALWAAKR